MCGFITGVRNELRELGCDDVIKKEELSLIAESMDNNDSPQFCAKWIRFYRMGKIRKLNVVVH